MEEKVHALIDQYHNYVPPLKSATVFQEAIFQWYTACGTVS